MGGTIVLGCSGWEYPEWIGPFYPRNVGDKLRSYADRFVAVEVNTTFYRLPAPAVARSWVRRTPAGFRFAAKFPRTITHEHRLKRTEAELSRFLGVIEPLRESGRFLAALLQLPPAFPFDPGTARAFYETLPTGLPVAVEFRDRSWLASPSMELLREFGLAHVVVDEPLLPVRLETTAPFAYVRWHGHGAPVWYDYAYRREELEPWVGRLRTLAERTESVYGFFNNHFRGEAAANGGRMRELLGIEPPPWSRRLA
ncbi:MAG: DUF72 domain-containing protein [Thermoplasmata archaeon]